MTCHVVMTLRLDCVIQGVSYPMPAPRYLVEQRHDDFQVQYLFHLVFMAFSFQVKTFVLWPGVFGSSGMFQICKKIPSTIGEPFGNDTTVYIYNLSNV